MCQIRSGLWNCLRINMKSQLISGCSIGIPLITCFCLMISAEYWMFWPLLIVLIGTCYSCQYLLFSSIALFSESVLSILISTQYSYHYLLFLSVLAILINTHYSHQYWLSLSILIIHSSTYITFTSLLLMVIVSLHQRHQWWSFWLVGTMLLRGNHVVQRWLY